MNKHLRRQFWIELTIALASTLFLVGTALWNDWIELVFHIDPDHSTGALEWLIVGASFAVAVAFFALARMEWRRTAVLPA